MADDTQKQPDQPAVGDVIAAHDKIRETQVLNRAPPIAPIPDGKVPVVGPGGQAGTIDQAELSKARELGYRVATPEEIRLQQVKEKYGDTGGALAAAALGGLDTATFGFGKGLIFKGAQILGGAPQAEELMSGWDNYEAANKGAYKLGQAGGVILPAILSGGESLLGEGASLAAERAVAGAVGEGILSTTAKVATQGAAEGAVMGAGDAFTQDMLGTDHADLVEKMVAGAAKGGLYGGLIGGGLGLIGGTASKAIHNLPSSSEMAAGLAADSLQMNVREQRILEKIGLDKHRLGMFMLREPEIREAMAAGKTIDEIAIAFDKVKARYGDDIATALDAIEEQAKTQGGMFGAKPDVGQILQEVRDNVISPLEKSPFHAHIADRVEKMVDSFGERAGVYMRESPTGRFIRDELTSKPKIFGPGNISFKQLHEFRQNLDDLVFRESKALSTDKVVQELQDMRGIMEKHFRAQAEQLGSAGQQYIKAADAYKHAARGSEIAEASAMRQSARPSFGFRDTLHGLAGTLAWGPKGILLAAGSKVLRERGPQFAAVVLDNASKLSAMRGSADIINGRIATAAKMMVRSAPRMGVAMEQSREKKALKLIDHVKTISATPMHIQELVKDHIDGRLAPDVQRKYIDKYIRDMQFLAMSAPKGAQLVPALAGTKATKPNKAAITSWMRMVDVHVDPLATIEAAVKKNQLTRDHVEALDVFYPRIANELRMMVMTELAKAAQGGKMPSYSRRIQLGLLTKAPTDASLDPKFISSQQVIVNEDLTAMEELVNNVPKPPSSGGGKKRPKKANMTAGEGQLEEEDDS